MKKLLFAVCFFYLSAHASKVDFKGKSYWCSPHLPQNLYSNTKKEGYFQGSVMPFANLLIGTIYVWQAKPESAHIVNIESLRNTPGCKSTYSSNTHTLPKELAHDNLIMLSPDRRFFVYQSSHGHLKIVNTELLKEAISTITLADTQSYYCGFTQDSNNFLLATTSIHNDQFVSEYYLSWKDTSDKKIYPRFFLRNAYKFSAPQ